MILRLTFDVVAVHCNLAHQTQAILPYRHRKPVPRYAEQKKKIAEIDTRYKAKIAERKIFLEKSLSDAIEQHNHEEAETIRRQLADEIASLEDKAEADKEKIRNS